MYDHEIDVEFKPELGIAIVNRKKGVRKRLTKIYVVREVARIVREKKEWNAIAHSQYEYMAYCVYMRNIKKHPVLGLYFEPHNWTEFFRILNTEKQVVVPLETPQVWGKRIRRKQGVL